MSSNIIGEAAVRIRPETSGFDTAVRQQVGGAFRRAAVGVGGALLAGGAVRTIAGLIGDSGALQKSLRESVGLLGLTGREADRTFRGFSEDVRGLSRELGVAQEQLSAGLYEALGAGVPRGNVVDFLRVSSRAAIAGVTDLDTAVDGITTVMNAYGDEAGTAQQISDSLFQTVNAGKVRFDELASSLFNVAPIAAEAGVSLQEVGAAIATLTAGGVPGSVATTQLRQAIQSIVAPTVRAEKLLAPVFREAGFESGQAALQALGLQKTLGLVRDAAGGSSTRLQRLVGSVEGLNAVLTLTGKGAGLFTRELENQANAAGVTDVALAQIERSAGRSFQRAANAARNFGLDVGSAAAPAVARLADALEGGLNDLSASPGFRQGVASIADGIADAILDPQTIATFQTFGRTAVDVIEATREAAQAAAPAVQLLASSLGAVASTPVAPALLLTAATASGLGRVVGFAGGRLATFRAAQAASAQAAAANRAALLQSVSALGLVGPSSTRAAVATATAGSRLASAGLAARGLGAGLVALSGGPVSATVIGVSALAAGAFLLSQRQSLAEQSAQRFSDALRDQTSAASANAAALERVRDATSALVTSRVGIDSARDQVGAARADRERIAATPASDLGGEAAKRDALAAATNRLRAAEVGLRDARRQNVADAQAALQSIRERVAADATATASARRSSEATTAFGRAGRALQQVTATNRVEAVRYAQGLQATVRGLFTAQQGSQRLAAEARNQARSVDTTTRAGRQAAAALRQQAQAATATASANRRDATVAAARAIATNRVIASSKAASAEDRRAATARIAVLERLVGQLRQQGQRAGQASAEGTARGATSKKGEVRQAGVALGQAGAEGVTTTAEAFAQAGQNVGAGLVRGVDAQVPAAFAAGARLGAAAAAGARSARGADEGSPSRKTRETGRNLGRGIQDGMVREQGRTAAAGASLARSAIRAIAAGTANARAQGARIIGSVAEGFRTGGGGFRAAITTTISAALRDSVVTAQQNLQGLGSTLADLGGRAIEAAAPNFRPRRDALSARGAALDAASAADEERRLRNAVSLAEAGGDAARRRFEAAQAAAARRTPEQGARLSPLARERERQRLEELRLAAEDPARAARLDLERFLLGQDEARLSAEEQAAQEATALQREALNQQLADLTSNLSARRISFEQFNAGVNATLASNGVNIAAIGGRLGTAFVDQFNVAIGSLFAQGRAVAGAPRLPENFLAGIERPAQVALQEAVAARTVLRQAFAAELARVRETQRAQTDRLRATFTEEGSAGGRRIVASEQRQLTARAEQHKAELKVQARILAAIEAQPTDRLVQVIVNPAPGQDPATIAAAVARRVSRDNAQTARR